MYVKRIWALFLILMLAAAAFAKSPCSHYGIDDSTFTDKSERVYTLANRDMKYKLSKLRANPTGTDSGVVFDFGIDDLNGTLYYGLYPVESEIKYRQPVIFKRTSKIESGVARINILKNFYGKYDYVDYKKSGKIKLGYRIVNEKGRMLYDGKINISGTGPFETVVSIVEGPFINSVNEFGAIVSFETNVEAICSIKVGEIIIKDPEPSVHHELPITGLKPDSEYEYIVNFGDLSEAYSFKTAPFPGSRKPFTFAYASDGRANNGGGERSIYGVNAYIMKKIAAISLYKNTAFFQFTGDLINGYVEDVDNINLQYANWKRSIEPFAPYIPFIAGFGNHEALMNTYRDSSGRVEIDKFPYATHSGEAIFANNFVNPINGPRPEYELEMPGCFPSYDENAFYYLYDNIAMIVMNSNYWYAPDILDNTDIGGNPHGYIMDGQLKWLGKIITRFEADEKIDHIFVTVHTPILPNGGHVSDDMWYDGDNSVRAYIAGKPVEKGIIERRDQILDLLGNKSAKVKAVLTGDEHNYNVLKLTAQTEIYPLDYDKPKIKLSRLLWLINNGAAGAPYYGQEDTPWMNHLRIFSTQNAVVFFHIDGTEIEVEVINPDTLELLDRFKL